MTPRSDRRLEAEARLEREARDERRAQLVACEHGLGHDAVLARATCELLDGPGDDLGLRGERMRVADPERHDRDGDASPLQRVGDAGAGALLVVRSGPSALVREHQPRRGPVAGDGQMKIDVDVVARDDVVDDARARRRVAQSSTSPARPGGVGAGRRAIRSLRRRPCRSRGTGSRGRFRCASRVHASELRQRFFSEPGPGLVPDALGLRGRRGRSCCGSRRGAGAAAGAAAAGDRRDRLRDDRRERAGARSARRRDDRARLAGGAAVRLRVGRLHAGDVDARIERVGDAVVIAIGSAGGRAPRIVRAAVGVRPRSSSRPGCRGTRRCCRGPDPCRDRKRRRARPTGCSGSRSSSARSSSRPGCRGTRRCCRGRCPCRDRKLRRARPRGCSAPGQPFLCMSSDFTPGVSGHASRLSAMPSLSRSGDPTGAPHGPSAGAGQPFLCMSSDFTPGVSGHVSMLSGMPSLSRSGAPGGAPHGPFAGAGRAAVLVHVVRLHAGLVGARVDAVGDAVLVAIGGTGGRAPRVVRATVGLRLVGLDALHVGAGVDVVGDAVTRRDRQRLRERPNPVRSRRAAGPRQRNQKRRPRRLQDAYDASSSTLPKIQRVPQDRSDRRACLSSIHPCR